MVIGDSVWDLLAARRADCIGIGLLSGAMGKKSCNRWGPIALYHDPADPLIHLDELGILIVAKD